MIDFGLAIQPLHPAASSELAGTPLFMSPEQLRGEKLTAQSDLFSLGLIASILLKGRHPFATQDAVETADRILKMPPDLAGISEHGGDSLAEVLHQVLAKQPEERFASVVAFREALHLAWSRQGGSDRPALPWGRRAWLGLAAAVMLLAIATWSLLARRSTRPGLNEPQRTGRSFPSSEASNPGMGRVGQQEHEPHTDGVSGEWIDGNTFRMFNGIELIRFPAPASMASGEVLSPQLDRDGAMQLHDFSNAPQEFLVGRGLVTQRQYLATMGALPAAMKGMETRLDDPVHSITYSEVQEFVDRCNRGVDHATYFEVGQDIYLTFASYAYPILSGQATHEDLMAYARRANPSPSDTLPKVDPGHSIQGTYGTFWEWTSKEYRKPMRLPGAIDFQQSGEQLSRKMMMVQGCSQSYIEGHLFDCFYGINDHFHQIEGLSLHMESDKQTTYFRPTVLGVPGAIRFRYRWERPVRSAIFSTSIHSFLKRSALGVRARIRLQESDPPLEQQPWREILAVRGEYKSAPIVDGTQAI